MRKNFKKKISILNRPLPLADYFIPLIGDKKEVKIADIGSGHFSSTGQLLDGVKVEVYPSDRSIEGIRRDWAQSGVEPLFPIGYQNMEALTYESDYFDIVNCVNALDHTENAYTALMELIRVCKPGGWVYIDCALIQKTTRGHRHFWDALEDGTLTNGQISFNLKDYGFSVDFVDNGGGRAYNHIIAKLNKE